MRIYDVSRKVLIVCLFVLEVLMLTYWNERFGAHWSALILLSASLGIGLIGMSFMFRQGQDSLPKTNLSKYKVPIGGVIALIAIFLIGSRVNQIFTPNPIDIMDTSESDIIPLVGFMVERFMSGEFPYAPISDWGYTLTPTYMPMQWMPFSIAYIFDFDYRWIPFSILCIAILLYAFYLSKNTTSILSFILLAVSPWLLWWMIIDDEPKVFAYTIESLSTGYYIIFGLTLLSRKPVLIGLGIALCLLSRYSFVLWLPLLGMVFMIKDYKKLIPIVGIPLIAELVIYVIPFLTKDITSFTDSLASYTVAAVGEWQPYWQKIGEKPYHLFRGIGMAGLFYDFVEGDVLTRIKTLQVWHLLTSLISVFIMGMVYVFKWRKINTSIFLIASLKIYFVFFYYFIQVPYSYLMMVGMFMSILLIASVFRYSRGGTSSS